MSDPRYLEEFELIVNNNKEEMVLFEVYFQSPGNNKEDQFVGFQIIPIRILEKNNLVGKRQNMWLKLIIAKSMKDFFVDEPSHSLYSKRHDPFKYKVESKYLQKESLNNF